MIRKIDMENCITTSTFLGIEADLPTRNVPFNTLIGWNEERNNAGYNPASKPVNKLNPMLMVQNIVLYQGISIFFPETLLKNGIARLARISEITNAMSATSKDSLKN